MQFLNKVPWWWACEETSCLSRSGGLCCAVHELLFTAAPGLFELLFTVVGGDKRASCLCPTVVSFVPLFHVGICLAGSSWPLPTREPFRLLRLLLLYCRILVLVYSNIELK